MSSTVCRICHRRLKDPTSVARGIGPICYSSVKASEGQKELPDGVHVLVHEDNEWGVQWPAVPLYHVQYHSPDGFEWGYGGSGPADLALSILAHYLREVPDVERYLRDGGWLKYDKPLALHLYQSFKWHFIAKLPREGTWKITGEEIAAWLRQQGVDVPVRHVVYEGRRN